MKISADEAREQAWGRQSQLTKPPGSLGELENIAVELAGIQRTNEPVVRPAGCIIFAANHPVVANCPEVSAFPMEVTSAMVANFEAGGAASSVLCAHHGMPQVVVDVGVSIDVDGVGDLRDGKAMSMELCRQSIAAGDAAVRDMVAHSAGLKLLILGEMGIGNTTVAAALTGAVLGESAARVTGRGTGVADPSYIVKLAAVRQALENVDATSAETMLASVGGREVAAMVGAMIAAAELEIPVLVDGYIVTSAALVAVEMHASVRDVLLFAHQSREQGHQLALKSLSANALLDMNLALGEASGALVAYPMLEQACILHNKMATFEAAGIVKE